MRCANSHEPDIVCADCDPERPVPLWPPLPAPPVDRDEALQRVHELQDELHAIDSASDDEAEESE